MNRDLEATLDELGPEYRSVVNRLRAPFAPRSVWRRHLPYLVAASLTAAVVFSAFLVPSSVEKQTFTVYTAAYANDAYALQAILASQKRDGSWANDYLTMQNAAALRKANDEASRIAYKRAVRYLRTKGLDPLSDAELESRSSRAFPAG